MIAWLTRHPLPVLLVFGLLTAVMGWQARHFELDASADTLLTEGNALYTRTQLAAREFPSEEFLLIAYAPRAWPVLSQQTLRDLESLEQALSRLDRVAAVRSIRNVPLLSQARGQLGSLDDPAQWTLAQKDWQPDDLARVFRKHPIYEDLLINADQTATAVQVSFRTDPELDALDRQIVALQAQRLDGELDPAQRQELARLKARARPLRQALQATRNAEIEAIESIIAEYADKADLYMGGGHVLGHELLNIIRNDLIVFGAAIAGMICLVLLIAFRALRWVALPILCCAGSVLITLGLFGMLDFRATVISANFIALQLILTLALVVHLIVQYREEAERDAQAGGRMLVQRTLQHKASPVLYAGLTTSVGFASLLISGIAPVIAFGWMMVIAVAVSIVTSLVLFPAVLCLLGRGGTRPDLGMMRWLLGGLESAANRHGLAVGLVAIAVLVAGGLGSLRLDVENSFINYFRDSTEVHRSLAFIDREFGGTTPLDILVDVPPPDNADLIMSADFVQQMQAAQAGIDGLPATGKVLSVVNFTELARYMNDGKPLTEYELTAIYWLLDESVRENLLAGLYNPDTDRVRIGVRIQDTTEDLDRGALVQRLEATLQDHGLAPEQFELVGLFMLYQDLLARLFESQILTLGVVLAALFVAFLLIFRSLRVAAIAIVPNILSIAVVLGTMGWLGIALDFMTITIAAVAMGIAVDDTIHYVHRYLEERDAGTGALARTHRSVGYALLYTSLIIALGFSLLAFSDFIPSVLFGLLTALAMLTALLADLTVLPALLKRFAIYR